MTRNQHNVIKASLNFAHSALFAYVYADSVEERDYHFKDIAHAEEMLKQTLESLAAEEQGT